MERIQHIDLFRIQTAEEYTSAELHPRAPDVIDPGVECQVIILMYERV